jgi:prephenate dehydratase
VRVAFLGPAGTFTEEALRASAPGGVEELPYPTVYETVMAVQEGTADRAVVPIENSLEGSVAATLDALAGEAKDVRIAAEVLHPIHHCLIARRELRLDEVERVVSHPQATAQCAQFLRERLADAERASASSTAEAVRLVAGSDAAWAAIGPRLSAELYECRLLAESVEDRPDNVTRFVWLAPVDAGVEGAPSKTSVVFWGFNDDSPGALVAVLSELSDRGINLTKIESRPRRVQLGHYMFFADLEGGAEDPEVKAALDALGKRVETLRILGSYPAA